MPAHRMVRFEIFIGTWNTRGDVLATESAPASILSASDTYRWLPGRHFIAHDADARFGGVPARSMEVIGYDLAARKYIARSFDDQGVTEQFEVILRGRSWRILGTSTRFAGRFDADGNTLTGLWELKGKMAGWQPWIKLTLVRA